MKYRFLEKESRISDFLQLPRLLFDKDEDSHDHIEEKKAIISEFYKNLMNDIKNKLRPFTSEIEVFFMRESLNDYDLISLLTKIHPILGYENEQAYLDHLLTLNELEIKRSIIHAILINENEENIAFDEVSEELNAITSDNQSILTFIKTLPMEASYKWNLFLIIEEPQKYIKLYVDLMRKLHPIFNEVYTPFEDKIHQYGHQLVDFLNKDPEKSLDEISFSTLSYKLLEDKAINIYISVLFPYRIQLTTNTDRDHLIIWGIEMEETFKKLNEINENKTNERVQIFKNLGDKTRYEVLKLIASGVTSTKEIAETLGVSSATISYHISNFITTKVIKMDNTNKKFGYIVDYDLLENVINELKIDLKFPNKE